MISAILVACLLSLPAGLEAQSPHGASQLPYGKNLVHFKTVTMIGMTPEGQPVMKGVATPDSQFILPDRLSHKRTYWPLRPLPPRGNAGEGRYRAS
jgi:hypothetical protein